jgi:hypothetical protein
MNKLLVVFLFGLVAVNFANSQVVGGWKKEEVNSERVQNVARWAAKQIASSNGLGENVNFQVNNVETQIVSGVNYRITADISDGSNVNSELFNLRKYVT